jgi:hypothetical protein
MCSIAFSVLLLTAQIVDSNPATSDVRTLIDTIESLQRPVEDFRCEFEGTMHVNRVKGDGWENSKLGEGGLLESFGGAFIWKRGGDIHSETLIRRGSDNRIKLVSVVVRMKQNQAEQYESSNDGALYPRKIGSPAEVRKVVTRDLGSIFLLDSIKKDAANKALELSVTDGQLDGRPLKVVNVALKMMGGKSPSQLGRRYWVDLQKGGHVVRQEWYQREKVMSARLDVELGQFKLGDSEVWMPKSGTSMSYAALVDKEVVIAKEPCVIERIHVLDPTMQFNLHSGPEVVTSKYKPGTPISDSLRKLIYEYGQQKLAKEPTKAEIEKTLRERVADAQKQNKELVVASSAGGFDRTILVASIFGGLAAVLSIFLWNQRRRH